MTEPGSGPNQFRCGNSSQNISSSVIYSYSLHIHIILNAASLNHGHWKEHLTISWIRWCSLPLEGPCSNFSISHYALQMSLCHMSHTWVFIVYPSIHSLGQGESNKKQFVEVDFSASTSLMLAPSWAQNEVALTLKPHELFKLTIPQNAFLTQSW